MTIVPPDDHLLTYAMMRIQIVVQLAIILPMVVRGGADQDECTGDGGCTGGDQSSPDGDRCESPEDSCTDPSKDTPAPPPSE